MCNFLHDTSRPIPEKGVGWKIFSQAGCKLYQANSHVSYHQTKSPWIKWNSKKYNYSADARPRCGFCFFLNRKDAESLVYGWEEKGISSRFVIRKIKYNKGLGKHRELSWVLGIFNVASLPIALCKEFRVIKE